MPLSSRVVLAGCSFVLFFGLITGCANSNKLSNRSTKNKATVTVHTNKHGIPIAPYAYKKVEIDIVPSVSGKHISNSFGYVGKMIVGAKNTNWLALSLVEQAFKGAGMKTSLKNQTLNISVPKSIGMDKLIPLTSESTSSNDLAVSINGHPVGAVPWFKTSQPADSYVPDAQVMKLLSPIHVQMRWSSKTAAVPRKLYIGSPLYGLVTTIITFANGHGSSTRSGMTIVHNGNNWIPYNYIMDSLDNAQYGIQVNLLNGFSGIDITVPASIPVNMSNLPIQSSSPKGEVPVEINHHVVAYANSMVPKFGPSIGYLSSAEVMRAIKRIDISMHWNKTDGTFTQWTIQEKSAK